MKILILITLIVPSVIGQTGLTAPPNCLLPVKQGPCKAAIQNFFYNVTSGNCEPFTFGGCGGNDNRFQSLEQCQRRCSCHFPPTTGPCRASAERWFYSQKSGCCEKFIFGGCQGNGNNFQTKAMCEQICESSVSGIIKPLGIEWGSGYNRNLVGDISYGNYGSSFGGSGTIWVQNGVDMINQPIGNAQIMRVLAKAGRKQMPGMQTKINLKMQMDGGKGFEILPVGHGGQTSQMSMTAGGSGAPTAKDLKSLLGAFGQMAGGMGGGMTGSLSGGGMTGAGMGGGSGHSPMGGSGSQSLSAWSSNGQTGGQGPNGAAAALASRIKQLGTIRELGTGRDLTGEVLGSMNKV